MLIELRHLLNIHDWCKLCKILPYFCQFKMQISNNSVDWLSCLQRFTLLIKELWPEAGWEMKFWRLDYFHIFGSLDEVCWNINILRTKKVRTTKSSWELWSLFCIARLHHAQTDSIFSSAFMFKTNQATMNDFIL